MRYDSNNHAFRCYNSVSSQPVYLYEKVPTFTKDIVGHGESSGWYLIASPLDGVVEVDKVTHMKDNSFDLYRFNQAAENEWENWKSQENNNGHYHFALEPGRGYLYANSEDVTLTFIGKPYNGDGVVTLSKTNGADFAGWNLVGNPFAETAYIQDDHSFYTMNNDGSSLVPSTSTSIEAMEGIFVLADEDGEELTFSTTDPETSNGKGLLSINVMEASDHRDGNSLIDRAIVRFDEGRQLPKFQLRKNSTKVYIPQGNMDYAIVSVGRDVARYVSTGVNEMPVNFKAEKDGTYALNFNSENVDFDYLHLIDNMTGADVDLLATNGGDAMKCKFDGVNRVSTYTFEAKTTDYESRFKLVFVSIGEDANGDNETFAFYSNGNWIIANEGEATLQVIDVTGHILSSETINGSVSKSINAAPGVYMIRLINGGNVKVQKVVIK